jgi:hypothetical protein
VTRQAEVGYRRALLLTPNDGWSEREGPGCGPVATIQQSFGFGHWRTPSSIGGTGCRWVGPVGVRRRPCWRFGLPPMQSHRLRCWEHLGTLQEEVDVGECLRSLEVSDCEYRRSKMTGRVGKPPRQRWGTPHCATRRSLSLGGHAEVFGRPVEGSTERRRGGPTWKEGGVGWRGGGQLACRGRLNTSGVLAKTDLSMTVGLSPKERVLLDSTAGGVAGQVSRRRTVAPRYCSRP